MGIRVRGIWAATKAAPQRGTDCLFVQGVRMKLRGKEAYNLTMAFVRIFSIYLCTGEGKALSGREVF